MVATMAAIVARSILTVRSMSSPSYLCFSKRLFSSYSSIGKVPPLPGFVRSVRSTSMISHSVRFAAPAAIRLNQWVNRSGVSTYSPLNSENQPPNAMAPLFPGCDHEHWLIVMDKPGGEDPTKQEMIECYIDTLAKVLGSEEEAKKKIYNVSCERYFGFGCEIDKETSNKLKGMPGVMFVLADSYVDPKNKDYGAELLVNGEIVERSPERQRRVEPADRADRPRYTDQTSYVRLQRAVKIGSKP